MKHDKVAPYLVTCGCVIDASGARCIWIILPVCVFGNGGFRSSSEAFMEFDRQQKWTYRESSLKYIPGNYTGVNTYFGNTDCWPYVTV